MSTVDIPEKKDILRHSQSLKTHKTPGVMCIFPDRYTFGSSRDRGHAHYLVKWYSDFDQSWHSFRSRSRYSIIPGSLYASVTRGMYSEVPRGLYAFGPSSRCTLEAGTQYALTPGPRHAEIIRYTVCGREPSFKYTIFKNKI